jgi:hypothetical protein
MIWTTCTCVFGVDPNTGIGLSFVWVMGGIMGEIGLGWANIPNCAFDVEYHLHLHISIWMMVNHSIQQIAKAVAGIMFSFRTRM